VFAIPRLDSLIRDRPKLLRLGFRWISPGHLLLVLSLTLPVCLFAGAAWHDYRSEMAIARERVSAMTNSLAKHAEAVLETVDLVLSRVEDRVEGRSWEEVRSSPEVHHFLKQLRAGLPQVDSVFVVDSGGKIAASSRSFPAPIFDATSREYFTGPQAQGGIYVSARFRGHTTGASAFTVSRALSKNSAFDGVVAVTVLPRYFEEFYSAVLAEPGETAAALIRLTDASLLLRFPEVAGAPERLPESSPFMKASANGASRGIYVGKSSVDGKLRLAGFVRLRNYPLFVNYNIDMDAALAKWRQHLFIFAVFAVLGGLALYITARMTLARADQERRNLQALLEETELRQAAEAKLQHAQKLEALGRLTGGVAHDFNNLLAAILGGIQLATKHIENPKALRLLAMATDAGHRGAKLTNHMLSFARKQDVALQPVETNSVLRGMGELLDRTLGGLVKVHYDIAAETWPIIADPVQLEVAILNLAVNARDAMPLGGDLTVATRNLLSSDRSRPTELEPGDYVVISVCDRGEGMDEEVRSRAFEPFFTTKGAGKGTGLGLSMVVGFAAQIGGTAVIHSAPGRGTTVELYLRRALAAPSSSIQADRLVSSEARSLRILLVDDDDAVRQLTCEMLIEAGHAVTPVSSGRQAVDLLSSAEHYDLLITDFAMPAMNGAQLVKEAKELQPGLPIMFVSGYMEEDLGTDKEQGILSKPFTAEQLEQGIQMAIAPIAESNVVPLRTA
jgi:signal transduction histidine kinase